MENLPSYISILFITTTVATLCFLFFGILSAQKRNSSNKGITILSLLLFWLFITGLLSLSGFFQVYDEVPTRFSAVVIIPIITIVATLVYEPSRTYLKRIPITTITYIHLVRVPVEIIIWWLAAYHLMPELMTFEGINYDILVGVTAPFAAIFLVGLKRKRRKIAIVWNLIALLFLFNIVIHAVLSTPFSFQQLAFDQPNIAIFYFPFVWLPGFVVPAVLFAHLLSLIKLFQKEELI